MRLEHGLRLGSLKLAALKPSRGVDPLDRFDWVYAGSEFCENLLSERMCEDAAGLAARGRKVCMLTPMITDRGAAVLERIFKGLSALKRKGRLSPERTEVTVNDFGAVVLARKLRLPFRLNAGRVLQNNVFRIEKSRFMVLNKESLEVFAELGITRFEVSSTGRIQSTNLRRCALFGFKPGSFRVTMHYPYSNMTSTRACPTGAPDIGPEESIEGVRCNKECSRFYLETSSPHIQEPVFLRGNTLFLHFPKKFYSSAAQLAERRVDRLVYAPVP